VTEKNNRPEWKIHTKELNKLATEIYDESNFSRINLIEQLTQIFGEGYKKLGADIRIIVFIEFCFFKAEGPYSQKFKYYSKIIAKVLKLSPEGLKMLNRTADAAIANMVLNARGRLKFKISDYYELKLVLDMWKKMGLKPRSIESVFNAVMHKWSVVDDLKEKNIYLLALLKQVFPYYEKWFLPKGMDLSKAIYEQQRKRFESLIADYKSQNLTINEMIQKENLRVMPTGIQRNNFLSYLLKIKHKFRCQICRLTKSSSKSRFFDSHHIVSLEQGGVDHSSNMIVLCKKHHSEAHSGSLEIICRNKLIIKYKGRQYGINNN